VSTARRAYDLLRSYVNHELDRVRDLDAAARRELDDALGGPRKTPPPIPGAPTEPSTSPNGDQQAPKEQQIELARRILGVGETAPFDEIRKAFERLNKRSDPNRFPTGSQERKEAEELNRRVNIAYRLLTEQISTTEKRFRSLEID